MRWIAMALVAAGTALAAGVETFEIRGSVEPEGRTRVVIHGSTVPFSQTVLSDLHGKFKAKNLAKGTYTVAAFSRMRGEARLTVEVGPSTADPKRRVPIVLKLKETDATREALRRRNLVSANQLKTPEKAYREWEAAQKCLGRRDSDCAAKRLEKAVAIGPHFSAAWNLLGTIYYQTRRFPLAEQSFRRALEEDPQAFEPLVNLGGVLVNLNRLDEALECNQRAILRRPQDALANSQLGMTYFALGKFDLARKYLEESRRIDPAHFSHPQLLLAEIHLRQRQPQRAADDLEDFLKHHPDAPNAAAVKTAIARLRE